MSKCARNDEMNFILILKGKLSAPYRVYRVCLSRGQSPHRQKKEKTEKHKKAESGYAKRLQGNLQGEKEKMKRVKMSTLSSVAFVDCVCV